MPLSLTYAAPSGTIDAADIESNVDKVETFINGGMDATDCLPNSVASHHVRPPEFYGAPAPRTEMVSSDVHHRKTSIENVEAFRLWEDVSEGSYLPIPGLAATVHVMPPTPGEKVYATILCNWYCREVSWGEDTLLVSNTGNIGLYPFATFHLWVKRDDAPPVPQTGTYRILHAAGDLRISAQNYSIATKVELQTGINHIYVGAKIASSCPSAKAYRLLVGSRNFICDVHYI
jgi:hypothetical protein